MSLLNVIQFITEHPLNKKHKTKAILRFVKWQLSSRIDPKPIIHPFTEKAKLIVQRGMAGATGNLYCGLHEYNDMGFLLHLLRKEDRFADIGANIGSYTVLASAHIGAKTISIEPVPSTFAHLSNNIAVNQIENKVTALNIALGSAKGTIGFTSTYDTVNHVATTGELNTIIVPVETLDNIIADQQVPILLKIDVEGFETDVIAGGANTLQQIGLKAIIIELNGSGARYGYDEKEIHNKLLGYGFNPYTYDPLTRTLSAVNSFGTQNTIYIRDIAFVQQRLITALKVKILDTEF